MKPQLLAGQVAVITGAGSGIGRALALQLAGRGCRLAITDINEAALAETAAAVDGAEALVERLDVADRKAVFAHAEAVMQRFGQVDIVINNAGVDLSQRLVDVSFDDFEWLMGINFWGVVHGTKAFLPHMLERDRGTIVNVSSVFGLVGWPAHGTYCAAKFAVRGFTESLRHELVGTGVRALSVHPGGVKTNIVNNSRFYVDDIGRADKTVLAKEFRRMARTTPEQAAATVIRGIERGEPRILVGGDARFLDRLQRLRPATYFRAVHFLQRLMKRGADPAKRRVLSEASGPR